MTIDERLDRLVERHEALTQTVELLTKDIHDLQRAAMLNGESIEKLRTIAEQDGQNIRALARIAELHHERLERLEGEQ